MLRVPWLDPVTVFLFVSGFVDYTVRVVDGDRGLSPLATVDNPLC